MNEELINKLPIIEKGWQINLISIEEGYLYDDITCRAENRSKAKSIFIGQSEVNGMRNRYGEDISFLNIPVVRCKEIDLVEYKGQSLIRNKVKSIIKTEEHELHLDFILLDPKVTHCYIKKRGMYYRDNCNGYVEERLGAGVYIKEDACRQGRNTLELTIIPIDTEEHNQYLNAHIDKIKNRLI